MATTFKSATRPATWAGTNKPVVPSKPSTPSTTSSTSGGQSVFNRSTGVSTDTGTGKSWTGSGSKSTYSGGGGGGGGGGSSKPITNTSGQVTGVDTGSQSVVSTSSQQASNMLMAGLNKTTPTAGEILTRGLTGQKVDATNTLAGVKSYVTSERAKDYLSGVSAGEKSASLIGLNLPSDPLLNAVKVSQESKTMSMVAPNVLSFAGYAREGEISPEDYSYGATKSLQQNYQETYQREATAAFESQYQKELKNIDLTSQEQVDAANLRLSEFATNYPAEWEKQRGQILQASAGKILADVNLEASYLGAKQLVTSPSFIVKSAGIGAGLAAGGVALASVVSAPVVATVGTGALILGGGLAAFEYGKATLGGIKTYGELKDLGFTTSEATSRGLLSGANIIAPTAFGAAYGVVGAGVTIGTINYARTGSVVGYTKTDVANIERITNRPNAFKMELVKGTTTDTQSILKAGGQTSDLITGGSSLRQYKISLNTAGLSESELATAAKFNLRGNVFQSFTQAGKSITGLEVSKIKTGGVFGKTTDFISTFKGTQNLKAFTGVRTFYSQTGKNIEVGSELVTGRGQVKYENLFRAEVSSGQSLRLQSFKFEKPRGFTIEGQQTKFTGVDTSKVLFGGKGYVGSQFTGVSAEAVEVSGGIKGTYEKVYTDVVGKSLGTRGGGLFDLKVTKIPPSRSMKSFGGETGIGGSSLQLKQISTQTFIPPSVVSTGLKPAFEVSQTQTYISPYYGTGQYETTSFGKTSFGGLKQGGGLTIDKVYTEDKFSPITGTDIGTITRTGRGFGQKVITTPISSIIEDTRIGTIVTPGMRNNQRINQRQLQLQTTITSIPTPIGFGGRFAPLGIPQLGITLPSFPAIGINSMIGKVYKGKLRREYTPSIGAVLSGVKAPKISTSVKFAEMTGFQARPMITRASKRKKKR